MEFELSDGCKEFVAMVGEFAEAEVAPGADRRDRDRHFPRDIWKRMGGVGLLGLLVPHEYAGRGADFLTTAAVFEEFARCGQDTGLGVSLTVTTLISHFLLLQHANEEQKARYLPAITGGEIVPALAVSEREHGAHPRYLKTDAARSGSDYVINGRKMYVTNGPVADLVVVFAVTERSEERNGISALLVEKGTPGFSVGEIMDLDFCRSSPHGELVFEDCRVPGENLLGEPNTAFERMVRGVRDVEDSLGVATSVGVLRHQLDLARTCFGHRGGEISGNEATLLADFASTIEVARTLTYKIAWLRDAKRETTPEFAACQFYLQTLIDSGIKAVKNLCAAEGALLDSGSERLQRDMKIALIGRNVAGIRKRKFAERLVSENASGP